MNWRYSYALKNLVLKDFRVRYRNMALGVGWSVLNPMVMLGVLVIVFTYLFPNRNEPKFAIFLLLGLIPFNFFSLCVSAGTGCFVDNSSLIKKLMFPRYILPLSVVLSQTIHLFIQLGLLLILIVVMRVPFTWAFLWLPLIFAIELCFIFGITLVFATMNVFFRDVFYVVQSWLTILFWFTPIFYSVGSAHENLPHPLYLIYIANPLVGYVEGLRRSLLKGQPPELDSFVMALLVTAGTMALGLFLYRRTQSRLADYT